MTQETIGYIFGMIQITICIQDFFLFCGKESVSVTSITALQFSGILYNFDTALARLFHVPQTLLGGLLHSHSAGCKLFVKSEYFTRFDSTNKCCGDLCHHHNVVGIYVVNSLKPGDVYIYICIYIIDCIINTNTTTLVPPTLMNIFFFKSIAL